MSTEIRLQQGPRAPFRLAPGTSLRREEFGGLAYSHRTRRLHVIESRLAFEVGDRLDAGSTVDEVVVWFARGEDSRMASAARQVAAAVEGLLACGVLVAADGTSRDNASTSPGVVS